MGKKKSFPPITAPSSRTILCIAVRDFWERLTGDPLFYYRLAKAFGEVVEEDRIDGSRLIEEKINGIAREIEEKGGL